MSNTQKALSALNFAANVSTFAPLMVAIAALPKAQRPIELASVGTLLKAKATKVLKESQAIRDFTREQGLDLEKAVQYLGNTAQFEAMATAAKFGSLAFSQYACSANSAGLRINQVGAKTALTVSLNKDVCFKVDETRFISEFISYNCLTSDYYNMIMNRVVIVENVAEEGWKEVVVNDFLLKLVLIQDSDIVLDSLVMNPSYVLVLEFDHGVFTPVAHPMTVAEIKDIIYSIYGNYCSTYTAPSKALEGYVELGADLKGIAQVGTDNMLHSFLDAKKLGARQEKLNGDMCVARINTTVFLVSESDAKSLPYFSTGCFFASHILAMSVGACRVTSDINNLLIKGVTHYAPWIAGELGKTVSICASSSAKGGIVGLAANAGVGFEFETMETIPSFKEETITLVNGDIVKGVYAKVTLKITNAFTAELFTRYNEETAVSSLDEAQALSVSNKAERLLGFNKAETKALSVEIMQNCSKFRTNIIDTICTMEKAKTIQLKPAVTTLTQGEFENIALSFGDEVALSYMQSVIDNPLNKDVNLLTKAASQWLKGTCPQNATKLNYETVQEVVSYLMNVYVISNEEKIVTSLNTQFLRHVMTELGFVTEGLEWVHIPQMNIYVPTGEALYKDLFSEANDVELIFELPTALKYFMSSMMYLSKVAAAGNLKPATLMTVGSNLHFMIQDSLLNKKVSKLKVHGRYFTLLPGFWLENEYDCCILSRDMYQPQFSHLQWTKVNVAKHPVLFLRAVAGFRCFRDIPNVEVSEDLRAVYANTIFVHPAYLLQLQNDCDGDLARVSFDSYWLPLYSGSVLESCAAEFHKDYIKGEEDLGINLSKLPKHTTFSHSELYEALKQASEAKMNVALFTDNLHKLMAAYRSSPITERAVNKFGDKGWDMIKDAIIVVATMVQTDAMNAIKHDGGVTAGAALCSTNLIKQDGYEIAKEAMIEYLEQHSIRCDDKKAFASVVCSLLLNVHSVELNKHKTTLTNQYERLVFKNQPKEIFEYTDLDGNSQYGSRRANFFGMFAESWNVTGTYSMFTEYLVRFYGR